MITNLPADEISFNFLAQLTENKYTCSVPTKLNLAIMWMMGKMMMDDG